MLYGLVTFANACHVQASNYSEGTKAIEQGTQGHDFGGIG
jgi:hypothetical protein